MLDYRRLSQACGISSFQLENGDDLRVHNTLPPTVGRCMRLSAVVLGGLMSDRVVGTNHKEACRGW